MAAGDRMSNGTEGHDTSGPTTDDAMTRSEERLNVGTEKQETGRVRLRKHVVTENVTTTVPVSHEEVILEREPITDANSGDATAGPELSDEEHEVILHPNQPVTAGGPSSRTSGVLHIQGRRSPRRPSRAGPPALTATTPSGRIRNGAAGVESPAVVGPLFPGSSPLHPTSRWRPFQHEAMDSPPV